MQREVKGDPAGLVGIGRYTADKWEWFGYRLDKPTSRATGLGCRRLLFMTALLVLERDKMNGPEARVKAIYRVAIPH